MHNIKFQIELSMSIPSYCLKKLVKLSRLVINTVSKFYTTINPKLQKKIKYIY
jgi:hypothetical protein